MNICMIRHGYFPNDGRMRKEAFALLEAGFSLDVICLKKEGQALRENVKGARVFRIPLRHRRHGMIRYLYEYAISFVAISTVLFFLFIRKRYEYIQVNTIPDFLVFATMIPKLLGAKVVLDLHEPTPELWITKYGLKRLHILLRLQIIIEQLAIRYADQSITVTECLRRRFGERGANIDKITVVPNVCEEAFCVDSRAKDSMSTDEFRLVTHGLIEDRTGHDVVVRALNVLQERLPNLRFDILGEGEYKSVIAELARKVGCNDHVHFLGYVPFGDLLETLQKADVGIVALKRSPYSELIDTNKMYEYMAMHKPVIVSRLAGVEEKFDESCLMFFEPGNHEDLARCILELYEDPDKGEKLAENAYRNYDKLRWDKTKKIYLKIFEDLIR